MQRISRPKHETGTTLGEHPDLYPYLMEHIGETPVQAALKDQISQLHNPLMMASPDEAQFLAWLIATVGATKAIEIGVYGGSTTLAIAMALPEHGKVLGLDVSEENLAAGRVAWEKAGVAHKIEFRLGAALDSLEQILKIEGENSFDFVFVDADKETYDAYYEYAIRLVRPGGIIAIDNVLYHGRVNKPIPAADERTRAILELNNKVKHDKRVCAVMLPIADGVYLARKL